MNSIARELQTRFELVEGSKTDRDFYQGIYHYFDFIEKKPELSEIFHHSENEYRDKHSEIWYRPDMSDEEADQASAKTHKMESLNLFAVGATPYVRIYRPLEHYGKEESEREDIVAVILKHGVDYARSLNKWSPKTVGVYARWFEGKRDMYDSALRRFHSMFLDEIPEKKITNKISGFDTENSILKIGGKEVKISIKNDKVNGHYVLEYIFEHGEKEPADYVDILKAKFPNEKMNNMSLYRACKDINAKVSEQAGISNFLIIKSGKSGYTQINPDYL